MCSTVVSWVDGYENSRLRVAVFLQPVQGGGRDPDPPEKSQKFRVS